MAGGEKTPGSGTNAPKQPPQLAATTSTVLTRVPSEHCQGPTDASPEYAP